jgi:hypothetical protein
MARLAPDLQATVSARRDEALALLEEAVTDCVSFRSSGNALNSCHCPSDSDVRAIHCDTEEPEAWGLTLRSFGRVHDPKRYLEY